MASHNLLIKLEKNSKKIITIIILMGLIIGLAVTEKYFAYRNRLNQVNAVYYLRHIALRESPPLMADFFTPTPEHGGLQKGLAGRSYKYRIDHNGFVMPSEKYANPDLVLVFLGGSTTECMYMEEEDRFPYLAGLILEKDCRLKINSYNGGVAGNNSLHSLDTLLNKVLPLNPAIVVMMQNINDLSVLLYEKTYWNDNPYKRVIITEDHGTINLLRMFVKRLIHNIYRELLQYVNIRKLIKTAEYGDEFEHIRNTKITIDFPRSLQDFGENLELFIAICNIKHIHPVLMTMASRMTEEPDELILRDFQRVNQAGLGYADYKRMFDRFNDLIRQKAQEHGITLIDLAREIPQDSEYIYDSTHFTTKGSQKVAALIAAHLKPLVRPGAGNPARRPGVLKVPPEPLPAPSSPVSQ